MNFAQWLSLVLEVRGYQGAAVIELARSLRKADMDVVTRQFLEQVLFNI